MRRHLPLALLLLVPILFVLAACGGDAGGGGGTPATSKASTLPPTAAATPTLAAASGKIAFTSNRDGNGEIYVMNADGSGQINLTNNPVHDDDPAWSPDGTRIAFTSARGYDLVGNPTFEIYVMNADGSGQTRLTNNPGSYVEDRSPTWSPDGTRIAFTRGGLYGSIYAMNSNGSGQTELTGSPTGGVPDYEYYSPAWSPDGTRIAFTRAPTDYSGDGFQIYVMNADGSGQTSVPYGVDWGDFDPAWSPDGTRIAFTNGNGDGSSDIVIVNGVGSGQQTYLPLTHNSDAIYPQDDYDPAWSPDGARIAFTRGRLAYGNSDIYVMNADGSGQTSLTNSQGNDYNPAWLPVP